MNGRSREECSRLAQNSHPTLDGTDAKAHGWTRAHGDHIQDDSHGTRSRAARALKGGEQRSKRSKRSARQENSDARVKSCGPGCLDF